MKTTSTLKNFILRKEGWLSIILLATFIFYGCYEFFFIDQPTEAYTNDSFDVTLVAKADDTPGNDFTIELVGFGLFGVLLPEGWTVNDSIYYSIVASDSAYDGNGDIKYADKDYSNDGYLIHNAAQSQLLTDSVGGPEGYYWWGAKTDKVAEMTFFDSLYFTVTINTDDKTGTYYLQYAIGDDENAEMQREPADDISDPMPIEITENPAVSTISTKMQDIEFTAYPNPSSGIINVRFNSYAQEVIELTVFDTAGKTVLTKTLHNASNTIDLNDQKPGVYFIRLKKDDTTASVKILLQ